ncbi:MAG: hypothetical protein K9G64_04375 [Bacteroidia bacterium]|nr:hypothetical protein [Bacteroidia bacterium]
MFKSTNFILLIFAVSSCGIYRQNVINVPAFENKGQMQIGVHQSFSGLEAQASLSVTDKIAVLANYCDLGEKKNVYSSDNFSVNKHYFSEIGIGVYKKKSHQSNSIKEFFLLGGNGKTSYYVESMNRNGIKDISYKEAFYNRITLQGDFGLKEKKVSLIFSPRIFLIDYYNIFDTAAIAYKQTPNSFIRFEVATTLRYNFNNYIALSGQTCITFPEFSYYANGNIYDEFSVFNVSIGIIGNLNFLKHKSANQ